MLLHFYLTPVFKAVEDTEIGVEVISSDVLPHILVAIKASFLKFNMRQARSQTFFVGGRGCSNWSNFGTFYDYVWNILRSRWIWPFLGGSDDPSGYGPVRNIYKNNISKNVFLFFSKFKTVDLI